MSRKARGQKAQLLELCVDALRMIKFHVYTNGQYGQLLEEDPDRYVRRDFPHLSLYRTGGRKEALIAARGEWPPFIIDDDDWTRVVLEAKWQEGGGSVDEKLPYVWLSFLESPVMNWVLVLDGNYWQRHDRGQAAVEWAKERPVPIGRTWHVVNRSDFITLAHGVWSGH